MESIILEQPTSFRHVGLQKGGKICKGHPNNSINGAVAQHVYFSKKNFLR